MKLTGAEKDVHHEHQHDGRRAHAGEDKHTMTQRQIVDHDHSPECLVLLVRGSFRRHPRKHRMIVSVEMSAAAGRT